MDFDIGPDVSSDIGPTVDVTVECKRLECSLAFARRMAKKGRGPSTVIVPGTGEVPLPKTARELERLKEKGAQHFNHVIRADVARDESKDGADTPWFEKACQGRVAITQGDENELRAVSVGWVSNPLNTKLQNASVEVIG